jgi:hypothetical protein
MRDYVLETHFANGRNLTLRRVCRRAGWRIDQAKQAEHRHAAGCGTLAETAQSIEFQKSS